MNFDSNSPSVIVSGSLVSGGSVSGSPVSGASVTGASVVSEISGPPVDPPEGVSVGAPVLGVLVTKHLRKLTVYFDFFKE